MVAPAPAAGEMGVSDAHHQELTRVNPYQVTSSSVYSV